MTLRLLIGTRKEMWPTILRVSVKHRVKILNMSKYEWNDWSKDKNRMKDSDEREVGVHESINKTD